MADVHSKEQRSFNMSRIRGKNTKPEMLVRRYLHAQGFRYKLHDKTLPGKPDLVLPKYKTVIFIHGCFWHGHEGCKYYVVPKTKTDWWLNKIEGNKRNDREKKVALNLAGWNVLEVFECELRKDKLSETITTLINEIKKYDRSLTNKNNLRSAGVRNAIDCGGWREFTS